MEKNRSIPTMHYLHVLVAPVAAMEMADCNNRAQLVNRLWMSEGSLIKNIEINMPGDEIKDICFSSTADRQH